MRLSIFLCIVLCLNAKEYTIAATQETTTLGLFDLNKPPVVKIHSGDIVTLETWNSCLHEMEFNKTSPADVAKFYKKHDIQKRRGMHTLTGPVYIEEAEPGDILEIRILKIQLTDWGYNFLSPTQGILSEFTKARIKYFKFDKEQNTTEFSKGICLHLKPFPGIIAVCPPGLAARLACESSQRLDGTTSQRRIQFCSSRPVRRKSGST